MQNKTKIPKNKNKFDANPENPTMQIRVVNAFRQGVDPRLMERTNPALAAVLQRQASASLAKRLSQASSIDYADAPGATGIGDRERDYLAPEVDMERLSSRSHTETAVWERKIQQQQKQTT